MNASLKCIAWPTWHFGRTFLRPHVDLHPSSCLLHTHTFSLSFHHLSLVALSLDQIAFSFTCQCGQLLTLALVKWLGSCPSETHRPVFVCGTHMVIVSPSLLSYTFTPLINHSAKPLFVSRKGTALAAICIFFSFIFFVTLVCALSSGLLSPTPHLQGLQPSLKLSTGTYPSVGTLCLQIDIFYDFQNRRTSPCALDLSRAQCSPLFVFPRMPHLCAALAILVQCICDHSGHPCEFSCCAAHASRIAVELSTTHRPHHLSCRTRPRP